MEHRGWHWHALIEPNYGFDRNDPVRDYLSHCVARASAACCPPPVLCLCGHNFLPPLVDYLRTGGRLLIAGMIERMDRELYHVSDSSRVELLDIEYDLHATAQPWDRDPFRAAVEDGAGSSGQLPPARLRGTEHCHDSGSDRQQSETR